MTPPVALEERVEGMLRKRSVPDTQRATGQATVLIATVDPEIRNGLTELFQAFPLNTIWLQGVEAAKKVLAKEKITACLCGFWLQDGTYRELVRHVRRERVEIPVIIVSAPACPHEYRDYLAAMNIGALDYLCHPYRKSDLETMLQAAMGAHARAMRREASQTPLINPNLQALRTA